MDSDTFSQREVIGLSAQVLPLRLDVEKEGKAVAKRFGVQSLPRILLIDAHGAVWCSIQGYLPPATFATEIKKSLDVHARYAGAARTITKDPSDIEAIAVLSYVEAHRGNLGKAVSMLGRVRNSKQKGRQLAVALNACGEAFFRRDNMERAADYFRMAEKASSSPYEDSYAAISLAYCLQKQRDFSGARQVCERLIKAPNAPTEFVQMARDMLRQISK